MFEEHNPEYESLMQPGVLKIGVQICAGNNRVQEGGVHLQDHLLLFDCALQIAVGPMSVLTCCMLFVRDDLHQLNLHFTSL